MPTLYPKCPPSEVLGFLVLLNAHRGSREIARVAEEENLPVDKLLPAIEYAEGLGLVTVADGTTTLTDSGRMLMAADIRVRKDLLRELLKRTILFRAILRSVEQSVDHTVSEDELRQIVAFTTAPPEAVQDIVNWGRYTGIFRYDANRHAILPSGLAKSSSRAAPAIPMPSASNSGNWSDASPPRRPGVRPSGTPARGAVPRSPGPRPGGPPRAIGEEMPRKKLPKSP